MQMIEFDLLHVGCTYIYIYIHITLLMYKWAIFTTLASMDRNGTSKCNPNEQKNLSGWWFQPL